MLLTARGLRLDYGDQTVLDGVDLSLSDGALVGLIGPNGAGKSSLLRCLSGLQRPGAGEILLRGRPLAMVAARERARLIAYLAQGATVHWPLTVERVVALGRLPHLGAWSQPSAADRDAVDSALAACDAAHLRTRGINTLSGGERARVLLARALAVAPDLLLADEPVAGLDPFHQLQVMELLRERARSGPGVLLVLHDLALAARFCDRLLLMAEGRIQADGTPTHVLDPDLLGRIYQVRFAAPDGAGPAVVPMERLRS